LLPFPLPWLHAVINYFCDIFLENFRCPIWSAAGLPRTLAAAPALLNWHWLALALKWLHSNPRMASKMKIHRISLSLALLSMALLALSGFGVRASWWPFSFGFQVLFGAVGCAVAASICALTGLVVPRWRTKAPVTLVLSIALGVGVAWFPVQMALQAKALPAIHDISTDLSDPPAFSAVLALRADAANPAAHGGAELAAAQRSAYPDIAPLMLAIAPDQAYVRALAAARKMGWQIVAFDASSGRIEATATTFWFGFKDDVVIRITPASGASRIDVRSVSRVGKSDVGANAARIRAYLAALH
jgi:uncharacterized protein (DUF1499 family)